MHAELFQSGLVVCSTKTMPPAFDARRADDATLAKHGIPVALARDPMATRYFEAIAHPSMTFIPPSLERHETITHGPMRRPLTKLATNPLTHATGSSNNWSGVVTYVPAGPAGVRVGFATAGWTVPNPVAENADGSWYRLSSWVGIDGHGDGAADVFQMGVESDVQTMSSGETHKRVYAWIEWFPDHEIEIKNFPVSVGDEVSCLVFADSPTTGFMSITNKTTRQFTQMNITAPDGSSLQGNCVEWAVERPADHGVLSNLARYLAVTFTNCFGQTNTPGIQLHPDSGSPINMVDDAGNVISTGVAVDDLQVSCSHAI